MEVGLRPQNGIWIFRAPRGIIQNTFKVKIYFTVHNYFLILLIVHVVIVVGEWKEHGFVVQAGRRMAYKGTDWVEAYSYIGSCERDAQRRCPEACLGF